MPRKTRVQIRAACLAENAHDTAGTPERTDAFLLPCAGNRTGWSEVASRGAMLFNGKNNGLNQYFSWNNSYPVGDPQHWGTTTNYDDDVGGDWGAPGAANGVLMQDGWITAGYNALNQPVSMWSKMYSNTSTWMKLGYDPLGRLVKRWKSPSWDPNTTAATFFYYDGTDLVQEGPSAAIVSNIYVHGGRIDEIVASQVSGVWYNHHYDGQGNCIALSNSINGGIEQQYDYDAFGFPYFYTATGGKAGSPKTRFLFTGREWIVDMRVYDYRARLYQPELGRFLQPDPQEFTAGDYNLYRYCHNDPVNKNDPTGLREEIAGDRLKNLTSWGRGDWDFFNGDIALAQLALQQDARKEAQGANTNGPHGQGLKYGFDRYPEKGPGGRPVVDKAMKRLGQTAKGRAYRSVNRTVYVRRADRDHPTGSYIGAITGNRYLYLDPSNERFYDETTFRNMSHHKGEMPPDSTEGRAAVIAHEFGHGLLDYGKDIESEIRNVRDNENPAREQLGIERRPSYQGNPVPP